MARVPDAETIRFTTHITENKLKKNLWKGASNLKGRLVVWKVCVRVCVCLCLRQPQQIVHVFQVVVFFCFLSSEAALSRSVKFAPSAVRCNLLFFLFPSDFSHHLDAFSNRQTHQAEISRNFEGSGNLNIVQKSISSSHARSEKKRRVVFANFGSWCSSLLALLEDDSLL